MNIEEIYKIYLQFPSVVTDTRNIKIGDIFFALKGPNFNGNMYAEQAVKAGAAYCICDERTDYTNEKIIYVDDSLLCMQSLAKHHRQQFNIPVIAITGSNGKTTTKELVHVVLSKKYRCYTTKGNLNNHIGIPLTILAIKNDAEIAVIEMGANHLYEIENYCTYAMPTHGIIVNCGKAHLEGFGSEDGVRKAKGELYNYLEKNNGTIFINTDYNYLLEMSNNITNKITYGTSNAMYTGIVANDNNFVEVKITIGLQLQCIKTKLAGNYNLPNILSAVCIGKTFGVNDSDIKDAIENYTPSNSRSQIIKKDTNTILLDAYNANPSSMKAAIENFAAMDGNNKIVILGGMMELGLESIAEHTNIINLLLQHNWKQIIVTGKDYQNLPPNILHFNNSNETAAWYKLQNFENCFILIKGSRGMAMEKLLD
ncbi:MAG: UDP-N-acetylmuramoyl-tripeptide--D-alanyl-D-alanine ligase [Ferruginibacter sp.]|nr:UDP-N-acetylmuramoyl-tripeptide--D-alanyl-D-alanine ligase [Ferruginibacter sp.]